MHIKYILCVICIICAMAFCKETKKLTTTEKVPPKPFFYGFEYNVFETQNDEDNKEDSIPHLVPINKRKDI
ncbi:hypothetical protein CBL_04676 [Carabus blaptoides fortunei]